MEIRAPDNVQRPTALHQDTQQATGPAERDVGIVQGLEKIAASVELLRLEMQGIRMVLEALVAKP